MKEFAWAIVDQHGHVEAYTRADAADDAWRHYIDTLPEHGSVEDLKALGCRSIRVRLLEVGPA